MEFKGNFFLFFFFFNQVDQETWMTTSLCGELGKDDRKPFYLLLRRERDVNNGVMETTLFKNPNSTLSENFCSVEPGSILIHVRP